MTSKKTLSANLYAAFAVMAFAVCSVSAQAAEPDEVTISAPATRTVGHDYATNAPIQETTVKVAVSYDPVTLTTNSGVALLKDSVADAAPLNLFSFVWVEDMAHGGDPRQAQLEWDYFKRWHRNADGSLSYTSR